MLRLISFQLVQNRCFFTGLSFSGQLKLAIFVSGYLYSSRSKSCYNVTNLHRIHGNISPNKLFGLHPWSLLYLDTCSNGLCYKEVEMYFVQLISTISIFAQNFSLKISLCVVHCFTF